MICVKKIIPFRKDLEFNTPLYEVTSISLEHHLTKKSDTLISGNFIISGDYKQTESSENKDPFNFTLPFDIALATKINLDDMLLDVDDFYYETGKNTLKVNIDLLLDATEIKEPEKKKVVEEKEDREDVNEKDTDEESKDSLDSNDINDNGDNGSSRAPDEFNDINYKMPQIENLPNSFESGGVSLEDIQNDNFIGSMNTDNASDNGTTNIVNTNINNNSNMNINSNSNQNINENNNLFASFETADTYTAYRVYLIKEEDTIDTILKKYNVTKEDLSAYNDLSDIKYGDKIIIPYKRYE